MNKTLMTTGIALALGVVWTAGPALAQQTTGEKIEDKTRRAGDKIERGAEKTGDKLERAADRTGDKAERAADKAEDKAERAGDKAESAWDKTKDKAREVKDTVKDKTSDLTDKAKAKMDRANARAEHRDVMAMQQALKDKGHDPGPIDGVVGPRTRAALRDYQRAEGLTPTGRWNDETAAKLGVAVSASPTTDPAASVGRPAVPPATPEDKTAPGERPRRPASP
jgi:hypothetical protein